MKKLGFGNMRLPLKDANDPKSVDIDQLCQMVDLFIDAGFNYFDTAYMYHDFTSENFVRDALVKRYPRDKFILADKLPTMMLKVPEDQERIFNEQLEKCGVEYFDYYMLHNLGVNHYAIAQKMNSFDFIERKKAEGKAKHIGFSFHDNANLLDQILTEHPNVDFVQLQINYLDWENESIQSKKCYEVAVKHKKPVIVMEPVKGGNLANIPEEGEKWFKNYCPDMSLASWAIRYAASLPNVKIVLSGMSSLEQVKDNLSYMSDFKPLNDEEITIIKKAVEIINNLTAVPCTSCRYCVNVCPKHIAIPEYFALYNSEKQTKIKGLAHKVYYGNYIKNNGKASDCIQCRRCEKECPQHIEISEALKDVAKAFE